MDHTSEPTSAQLEDLARRVTSLEETIERMYAGSRRAIKQITIAFFVYLILLLASSILLRVI
jgi:hypothetical protein